MRTRWRWVVVGLMLVALVAFALWPAPDRITQESCDRLQVGMPRAKVEHLLGGPPGDYAAGPMYLPVGMGLRNPGQARSLTAPWLSTSATGGPSS